jgi:sugar/nucleoside kinase (ribokinase family)
VPDILERAQALGLTTSLDTNWDPEERWNSTLAETFPLVDLFMPNEQEALHISGTSNLQHAVEWFRARGASLVVIKRGVNGAQAFDGSTTAACTVTPATGGDSTGAGDSFDAGYLTGWLRGLPTEQCLEIACQCGRLVAGEVGGLRGQPAWEDIARYLACADG